MNAPAPAPAPAIHQLDFRRINPYDGSELPPTMRAYRAKSGKIRIKPSMGLAEQLDDGTEGFCISCGSHGQLVEPDAAKYICDECGEAAVYGASELIMRGLVF